MPQKPVPSTLPVPVRRRHALEIPAQLLFALVMQVRDVPLRQVPPQNRTVQK
jgi:hypothetical protein